MSENCNCNEKCAPQLWNCQHWLDQTPQPWHLGRGQRCTRIAHLQIVSFSFLLFVFLWKVTQKVYSHGKQLCTYFLSPKKGILIRFSNSSTAEEPQNTFLSKDLSSVNFLFVFCLNKPPGIILIEESKSFSGEKSLLFFGGESWHRKETSRY